MKTFREYLEEDRFAVVDPKTNKPHFITSDERSANKVAKQKGMEVRQIFGPKSRNFTHIKLIK